MGRAIGLSSILLIYLLNLLAHPIVDTPWKRVSTIALFLHPNTHLYVPLRSKPLLFRFSSTHKQAYLSTERTIQTRLI